MMMMMMMMKKNIHNPAEFDIRIENTNQIIIK